MGAPKGAGKGKTAGTGKGKAQGKGSLPEWACTTCGCGNWITKAYCRTREFDGSLCKGTRPPAWAAQANKYTLGDLQAGPQTTAPSEATPADQAPPADTLPKVRLTSKQSATGTAFGGPAPPPGTDEEQIQKLEKSNECSQETSATSQRVG